MKTKSCVDIAVKAKGEPYVDDISIPVAFELIKKPIVYSELKTRKVKRKNVVTKNELMQKMLGYHLYLKATRVAFDEFQVLKAA